MVSLTRLTVCLLRILWSSVMRWLVGPWPIGHLLLLMPTIKGLLPLPL